MGNGVSSVSMGNFEREFVFENVHKKLEFNQDSMIQISRRTEFKNTVDVVSL